MGLSFTRAAPRSVKTTASSADQNCCPEADYFLMRRLTNSASAAAAAGGSTYATEARLDQLGERLIDLFVIAESSINFYFCAMNRGC